ncbi:MAG: acyl-CoA dehydrogenase [Acidimicrobiia bacterium]|nr:acyl-CoA dehydrogenase [Acidimicrobiia bacterium]
MGRWWRVPSRFDEWIGRTEIVEDLVTAWPIDALRATFDLPDPPARVGDAVPPMWHWLFFLSTTDQSQLGPDGHAQRGGFLPPVDLPRRMFAGGRTEFLTPLRIGQVARRTGTVVGIEEKEGRSGPLVFVTARFEVSTDDGPAIVEEQDLVYREAASGRQHPAPGNDPIPGATWEQTIAPDSTMLFRFSALTFNGHRIHYDHPYVTDVEGYPGLIVHGPMTALWLLGLGQSNDQRPVTMFSFRGRSPLFCNGPISLRGGPTDDSSASMSAWSSDHRLAMTAEVTFGSRR